MSAAVAYGVSDCRALGCGVRVVTTAAGQIEAARAAVDRVLEQIDLACSRFRPDAEIAAVNAAAGREVRLSPLLNRAVAAALDAAERTGGAVDPTVGAAVRLAGYDRDFDALPVEGEPLRLVARAVPGWRELRHDRLTARLLAPPGIELDLGATAKALAADLAAGAALAAVDTGAVLVSLGGDIAVAGEPPAGGWPVQVSEDSSAPVAPGEETVALTRGGLATSSTTVRRWRRGQVELHHIIDPRTGLPAAAAWRTVTVAAASCVEANTASTATVALGPDGLAWLAATGLPARLVAPGGAIERIGGWPVPDGARP